MDTIKNLKETLHINQQLTLSVVNIKCKQGYISKQLIKG